MNSKHLAALALAGTLAAGAAHAGNRADVQWSVTVGSPQIGVVVGSPVYEHRVYAPQVYVPQVYVPQFYAPRAYAPPVYVVPGRGVHRTAWHDADHDGIPNRYDRVYNPRWDRDGDGVPNRYDRRDDRRDARHDRRDDRDDRRHGR
ncbi:MAG: hypothetical protein IPF94_11395 [Betaproteobacteria bacterium]|nr:hypothetical protein [Betaproteobacteria bacterium]